MIAIDGNNSLKRIAQIGDRDVADRREFADYDYYLPAEFVDQFKDEVKHRREEPEVQRRDSDDEWTDEKKDDDSCFVVGYLLSYALAAWTGLLVGFSRLYLVSFCPDLVFSHICGG